MHACVCVWRAVYFVFFIIYCVGFVMQCLNELSFNEQYEKRHRNSMNVMIAFTSNSMNNV